MWRHEQFNQNWRWRQKLALYRWSGAPCYPRLAKECGALLHFVNHSAGEFARPEWYLRKRVSVHTATIDSVWAQVERCIPNNLRKYVHGHTHVHSYVAMAPLALKSACFRTKLWHFGRLKPTRNRNFTKEIVKNTGALRRQNEEFIGKNNVSLTPHCKYVNKQWCEW